MYYTRILYLVGNGGATIGGENTRAVDLACSALPFHSNHHLCQQSSEQSTVRIDRKADRD